jgi:hypothetical protein
MVRASGAYFGEVVRRHFGGFWRVPSPNVHDWQLCLRSVFLWINPVGIAYDAIYEGEEHEGPRSHLRLEPEAQELVGARLAQLPPLDERDYYRFSTRFEAIEIAVHALRLFAEQDGSAALELSEEDYAPGGLFH